MILALSLGSCGAMKTALPSAARPGFITISHNVLHIVHLESHQGGLLYYGAVHTFDPEDVQMQEIEDLWGRFRPTIAFSEGEEWPREKDRLKAIRKYGEQGLLRFLSDRDSVSYRCMDPSLQDQVRFLRARGFLAYEIKLYFILRQVIVKRERPLPKDYLDDSRRLLEQLNRCPNVNSPPFNVTELEGYVAQSFPTIGDWTKIPGDFLNRQNEGKFLFRVHQELLRYRDRIMLKNLFMSLRKGERVFAIVGKYHVFSQTFTLASLSAQPMTGTP